MMGANPLSGDNKDKYEWNYHYQGPCSLLIGQNDFCVVLIAPNEVDILYIQCVNSFMCLMQFPTILGVKLLY
jgi:hypothetical protein